MLDAYANHPEAFTSTVEERTALPPDWWVARLQTGSDTAEVVYGAFDAAGTLVGAAGIGREARQRARHKATLFGMTVAASARRAGVGRLLVLALLAHARALDGVRLVQLTVTEGNRPAQALYARCGFQVFGTEPKAMLLDGVFLSKVHMWCDLDAVPAA
ncbi:N-acetyltransferase [Acidovorax cavernicola]|uniref:N-acetyltransferase n=2 Tax=Acidovorax cavernicola TaxID=1675792 RepID=A0A9X8GXW2_9BURK|nr:N-acetyltransferase [Acidovorax cavernicola]